MTAKVLITYNLFNAFVHACQYVYYFERMAANLLVI